MTSPPAGVRDIPDLFSFPRFNPLTPLEGGQYLRPPLVRIIMDELEGNDAHQTQASPPL